MKRSKFEIAIQALAFILTAAVIVTAVLRYRPFKDSGVKLVEAKAIPSVTLTTKASALSETESTKKAAAAAAQSESVTTPVASTSSTTVLGTIPPVSATAASYSYSDDVESFDIPFDTEYRYSDELFLGQEEVLQYGVNGMLNIHYRSTYLNGVMLERVETGREVAVEPLTYIILQGTAVPDVETLPTEAEQPDSPVLMLAAPADTDPEPEAELMPQENGQNVPEDGSDEFSGEAFTEPPPSNLPPVDVTEPSLPPIYSGMIQSLGFSAPGSNQSAEANLAIIQSLMTINGSSHYLNYYNNGDGTITVDNITLAYTSVSQMKITSYDGYECAKLVDFKYGDCNPTASGILAQRGIVASSGEFPFGTVLFVEDYGLAVVADLHGMGSGFLDVAMNPHEIEQGTYVTTGSRNVYVISIP